MAYLVSPKGTQRWTDNQQKLHRPDGPAKVWADGKQEWWIHGQRHRIEGPAVIANNGTRQWFVRSERLYAKDVNKWMRKNRLTYPFDDDAALQFKLRFA